MSYIKALATESEGILHVLGNPFYGPDRGADSDGQYFDPSTDFMDEAKINPPVFYWHGSRTNSIPYQIADVTKTWNTDEGRWYEVDLYTKAEQLASNVIEKGEPVINEVLNTIKSLWKSAKNGTLFASTGAVPASVIVESNGRIAQWLVGELSLIDANLDEGRVPANFYASAIPVKLDSQAFEKLQRKQFFEFENLSITIPGGNVPGSLPEIDLDDEESVLSSIAKIASVKFDQITDTIDETDEIQDGIQDVIADIVEDLLRESMPMIDNTDQMAEAIAESVTQLLSDQESVFNENFINKAFEQAFLQVFQTFRSKEMPTENNNQPPATTEPATVKTDTTDLELKLAEMEAQMTAMKSSNEALTNQLRQTEANAATVHSQSFLDGLVKDGKMVASEVNHWMPVLSEAYALDMTIKSGGGEGKMLNAIMEAMKTRPEASILNDSGDGDTPPANDTTIKSGKILSSSAGRTTEGVDHSKVDPDTLNEMRRFAGVQTQ